MRLLWKLLLKELKKDGSLIQRLTFLVASKKMDANEFQQLRSEANSAYQDYQFLTQEADKFSKDLAEQQQTQLREQAKETVKILEKDIPNWNNELYNDVRSYAVQQGMEQQVVDQIVDPVAIKMIHKSRLYDEAKKKASIKKKSKVTTKVLKKSVSTDVAKAEAKDKRKSLQPKEYPKLVMIGNSSQML